MSVDVVWGKSQRDSDECNQDQFIVAGAGEDATIEDLLDWIMPMLRGAIGSKWSICQVEFRNGGEIFARYRSSNSKVQYNLFDDWTASDLELLKSTIPCDSSIVVITISHYNSQLFTLLDCVASWLSIFDPTQKEIRPIFRLLQTFEMMVRIGG